MRTPPPSGRSAVRVLNERLALDALAGGHARAEHRPVHVYVQVASACNLDCYMCSEHLRPPEARHGRGLISLAPELFDRLAVEALPYASQLTIGVGGEPMLSPHFLHYIERAREVGVETHLVTNGTRLRTDEMCEAVARCVDYVQLSIDGATAETYERIRFGSKWSALLESVRLLNRYRDASPEGQRAHLALCLVLMRSNVHELPAFVQLARELGADLVHAQHVIPITPEGEAESLASEPERYARYREEALRLGEELDIEVRVPLPHQGSGEPAPPPPIKPQPPQSFDPVIEAMEGVSAWRTAPTHARQLLAHHAVPCPHATLETYVFYDGRVFPCCHPHAHQKMQMGDLRLSSFGEIWNGARYRNLRAGLRSGDVPAICNACSIVHDPPPAAELLENLERTPDIDTHYAGREAEAMKNGAAAAAPAFLELVAKLRARILDHTEHAEALAERVAALSTHAGILERERPHLVAHVADIEAELRALKAHARTVEEERGHLAGHLANLEPVLARTEAQLERHIAQAAELVAERESLRGHVANLEPVIARQERWLEEHRRQAQELSAEVDGWRAHGRALAAELASLRAHAATLETERPQLLAHAATVSAERDALSASLRDVRAERDALAAHAQTLEAERASLTAHAANLERILTRIHGRQIYRLLCKLKDLVTLRGNGSASGA